MFYVFYVSNTSLRYDQVFIFFIISFFLPKTSKQVFHCRAQDAEFAGNSKVVDREIV